MRPKTIPALLLLVAVLSSAVAPAQPPEKVAATPLPELLTLTPSKDPLPRRMRNMVGVWRGTWLFGYGPGLPTTIVVESIRKGKVSAVYSWGDYAWSPAEKMEAGWRRVSGRVQDDAVVLLWGAPPKEIKVVLRPVDSATARGEYYFSGFKSEARLVKGSLRR